MAFRLNRKFLLRIFVPRVVIKFLCIDSRTTVLCLKNVGHGNSRPAVDSIKISIIRDVTKI